MEFFANLWTYLFWFLVLLTPLIFVHELGHFWVARRCGVRIEVFSIGFGRELFGWTDSKGTRWKVSAVPLGGYVKMFGEHALEPDERGNVRQLTADEKQVSFQEKPLAQRAAIVAAGPGANYLFAVIVAAVVFMTLGEPFTPAEIGLVAPDSTAEKAGFKVGDQILTVDGDDIETFEQFAKIVQLYPGRKLEISVLRDGAALDIQVVPDSVEVDAIDGSKQKVGALQVAPFLPSEIGDVFVDSAAAEAGLKPGDRIVELGGEPVERFDQVREIVEGAANRRLRAVVERGGKTIELWVTPRPVTRKLEDGSEKTVGQLGVTSSSRTVLVQHGPIMAVWRSGKKAIDDSKVMLSAIGQIITGDRDSKELGGPVMIAKLSSSVASLGFVAFLEFMVFISVNLGLINLLPIPVLDGGHLFFYLAEAIRGRPINERVQEISYKIGLALVISLMIFVTVNDIVHRVF